MKRNELVVELHKAERRCEEAVDLLRELHRAAMSKAGASGDGLIVEMR